MHNKLFKPFINGIFMQEQPRQQQAEAVPRDEYFRALSSLPIMCIENIPFRIGENGPEVLLVARAQEPATGCLYPIGKGLKKNQFSNAWALQALMRETQMEGEILRPFGLYEAIYSVGQHQDVKNGLHNPCLAYLTKITGGNPKPDETSSLARWVTTKDMQNGIPLPPYTRTLLEDSEVFSRDPADLARPGPFNLRYMDFRGTDFSKYRIK